MREQLKQKVLAGEVSIQRFVLPPKEAPAENLCKEPEKPQLQVCLWNVVDDCLQLAIPAHLTELWSTHEVFQDRFAKLKVEVDSCAVTRTVLGEPARKRPKLEDVKKEDTTLVDLNIQLVADIKWAISCTVNLPNRMTLLFGPENRILISNPTDSDCTLEKGTLLCGFLKGDWFKAGGEKQVNEDTDIVYSLVDASSEIVMQGGPMKLSTVGDELETRRIKFPTASIFYHTMEDSPLPGNVSFFKLSQRVTVCWTVHGAQLKKEGDGTTATQNHAAGLVPYRSWQTSMTKIVFMTKWTQCGLMPVRPFVFLQKTITLPPSTFTQLV